MSKTERRDLLVAVISGLSAEILFATRAFITGGELSGDHSWLAISQLPGAAISLELFGTRGMLHHYAGIAPAHACAMTIQSFLFACVVLALLYVYRMTTRTGV